MTRSIQELFGIDVPIVLGPFGGVSSVALTAAVSNAGGLGSYGLYGYTAERIAATAAELRAATDKPINLNLWWPTGDEADPADVDWDAAVAGVAPFYAEAGLDLPARPEHFLPPVDEQLAAVVEARPAVASFVYGVPDAVAIEALHAVGTRVVGTATNVAEARALAAGGVDAIIASGMEAAGHRVTFIGAAEDSLLGTFALVPQVVDAVDIPVLTAGGVADRRGVAAALALGAQGVVVGSAFLATAESVAPASHKAALRTVAESGTVLTRAMSGRLARGVENHAMRRLAAVGHAPFPAQNMLTGGFRRVAAQQDDASKLSLWAGQAASLATGETASDVFAELAAGF
ncbi:NAD(P)H-dependent flavin oxidoreductase [Microbacterium sp. YY-03]|uniref:NAD(P)H-dependent flavin oxidoreductase n=1 Tax=Microbacterium sp. YY-03 TaxID=3421636 RepID=UPI003D181542